MWCILAFIFSNLFSLLIAFMYGQLKGIANTKKWYEERKEYSDNLSLKDEESMCLETEFNTYKSEAKEIIRRLMDIINHDLRCFDTMAGLDVKQKAEAFLKKE